MAKKQYGPSLAEKEAVWAQFRTGASCAASGRGLGHTTSAVYWGIRAPGGVAPAVRRRRGALTPEEREVISRGVAAGETMRTRDRPRGPGRPFAREIPSAAR